MKHKYSIFEVENYHHDAEIIVNNLIDKTSLKWEYRILEYVDFHTIEFYYNNYVIFRTDYPDDAFTTYASFEKNTHKDLVYGSSPEGSFNNLIASMRNRLLNLERSLPESIRIENFLVKNFNLVFENPYGIESLIDTDHYLQINNKDLLYRISESLTC